MRIRPMTGQRFGGDGSPALTVPYSWLPKPVCPEHGVLLRVESTRAECRYLYCPVPGCRESKCQHRRPAE